MTDIDKAPEEDGQSGDEVEPSSSGKWSWKKKLGVVLLVFLLVWTVIRLWPAPADKDYKRPQKVSQTAFPQKDMTVLGVRIRYIDVGPRKGEPLILLPGHTSRIEEYDQITRILSKKFRVIVFDFPGSGYSEKPVRDYTLEYYEEVTVAVMDELKIEKAHLGGGSQGGNLTLGAAARYPDRFLRLVPWSPGSAWPNSPVIATAGWTIAGYLPFWPMIKYQSTFWLKEDDPNRGKAVEETFTYYDEVMGPGFIRMYWGIALDTVRRTLYDIAPKVSHPTLLIWGDQDSTPYMTEGIAKVDKLLPRSELYTFKDSPHSLAGAVPKKLAQVVIEFLSRRKEKLPKLE